MEIVLPELQKGDQLRNVETHHELRVARVVKGVEYEEPLYVLSGLYGVRLTNKYTGEDLANQGYELVER